MSWSKNPVLVVLLVLSLVGLFLVLRSPFLAQDAANAWLRAQGGSADTNVFLSVRNGFASGYQWLGVLFLGAGLLALVKRS